MSDKKYFSIWVFLLIIMGTIYRHFNLRVGNLYLGWIGFGFIILTNLYILRKRIHSFSNLGKLPGWLNFHIFCGLTGPALIIFHSGFKVRGLVAISFWSMIIAVLSGIVGRYIYVQISKMRSDLLREAESINKVLSEKISSKNLGESDFLEIKKYFLNISGASRQYSNVADALWKSYLGDIKIFFAKVPLSFNLSKDEIKLFKTYALISRKANSVDSFNLLMGYWHTFHTPFAIFMYLTAFVHIFAELILKI